MYYLLEEIGVDTAEKSPKYSYEISMILLLLMFSPANQSADATSKVHNPRSGEVVVTSIALSCVPHTHPPKRRLLPEERSFQPP